MSWEGSRVKPPRRGQHRPNATGESNLPGGGRYHPKHEPHKTYTAGAGNKNEESIAAQRW